MRSGPRLDALEQEGVRAQADEAQKRGDMAVCHYGVLVVGKDLQDGVGDGGREPVELEVVQGVRASGAGLDVGAGVLLDELADVGQKPATTTLSLLERTMETRRRCLENSPVILWSTPLARS